MRIITRQYRLEQIDFAAVAMSLVVARRWPWWLLLLIAAKAITLAPDMRVKLFGISLMFGAVMLPMLAWTFIARQAASPKNATFYLPRLVEIDEAGLFIQVSESDPLSIRWDQIRRARRIWRGWLLMTDGRGSHYLPYRAFRSTDDIRTFERWLLFLPERSRPRLSDHVEV